MTALRPLLAPGLKVVFVGTEPGGESLGTGCYYANPQNSFWRDLAVAGFTPSQLAPADFRRALTYGIGLDDVCGDPAAVSRRLEKAAPSAICFNSKAALARMAGEVASPWSGEDAATWVSFPGSVVWALHDSSPAARGFWPLRVRELRALAEAVANRS